MHGRQAGRDPGPHLANEETQGEDASLGVRAPAGPPARATAELGSPVCHRHTLIPHRDREASRVPCVHFTESGSMHRLNGRLSLSNRCAASVLLINGHNRWWGHSPMSGSELRGALPSPTDEMRHQQALDGSVVALEFPLSRVLVPW